MKKLQLFTMLTLLSTGYVMDASKIAGKAVDKVEEKASWSIRHLERVLDGDAREQSMTHAGLRRYINRVEKFIEDLKAETEFTGKEHEYLMNAVSDIHSKFNGNSERYSSLRSRVKELTEKAEAFLAAEQA